MKLITLLLTMLAVTSLKQIHVRERVQAIPISKGYAIGGQDTTFMYNGTRYLVKVREAFKDNVLESAFIWKPEGYLNYSKSDLTKDKAIMKDWGLSSSLKATLNSDKLLSLNNRDFKVKSIDKKLKQIYYSDPKDKGTLFVITYK